MKILVEVTYALPDTQTVIAVELNEGATVGDAIAASGILARHAGIDLRTQRVGIWGRAVSLQTTLRDRDRVELYRPLAADPKQVRRKRARDQRDVKPRR